MSFSSKLIELRKSRGLSQEGLGDKIGVTRQTVSKWELGETTPEMNKLIELSKLFQISIDELTGNEIESNTLISQGYHVPHMNYEYVSKRKIKGIPLVHIHIGIGFQKAKGIIAIGNIAKGVISIGIISMGCLCFGALSLGLLSFGAISLGLLLSFGGLSIGAIAFGGVAIGLLAIGGLSIGIYSIGGCAIAKNIAAGGYANAHIAIGDKTMGDILFDVHAQGGIEKGMIKETIQKEFPNTMRFIVNLFDKFTP